MASSPGVAEKPSAGAPDLAEGFSLFDPYPPLLEALMSDKRYVFANIDGDPAGPAIFPAEEAPSHDSMSFSEARAMYEKHLIQEIGDLQHRLVEARNMVEQDITGYGPKSPE